MRHKFFNLVLSSPLNFSCHLSALKKLNDDPDLEQLF